MGWRGTLRSLAAASRRIEREQRRKHTELLKRQQQAVKFAYARRAALEVEIYENTIDLITSVHRDCGEAWDWIRVKNTPAPPPPDYSNQLEVTQRQREELNKPGFWDKIFGRVASKEQASEQAIAQAKAADEARHTRALQEYESKLEELNNLQRIAAGIIDGDIAAYTEALKELNPLGEIKEIGRQVRLTFNPKSVEATITLHGQEHIPGEIKSLLKTGRISTKPASDSAIQKTYQTHVCSCVLRAARELFAVLPFETVFVHGMTELLNQQTGHKEPQVIISVMIPRSTFSMLNFEQLDPVDCMRNFVHRMAFSKLHGFSRVEPIHPGDLKSVASSKDS